MMSLEVLYKDEYLVAVNKPHGLLVHRSSIAKDASEFAVQTLRDQLNQKVYPVHRLDRKTSGVLLFALDEDTNRLMQELFSKRLIHKKYKAIVRGYTEDEETIDYPLRKENGTLQEAVTKYRTIKRTELNIPLGHHQTVRYSLVEVSPITGRMHQIRKHFAHILHPIIGDRPYGCNKQNRFFKGRWNMDTMMLHATSLSFLHPVKNCQVIISANFQKEFQEVASLMGWDLD